MSHTCMLRCCYICETSFLADVSAKRDFLSAQVDLDELREEELIYVFLLSIVSGIGFLTQVINAALDKQSAPHLLRRFAVLFPLSEKSDSIRSDQIREPCSRQVEGKRMIGGKGVIAASRGMEWMAEIPVSHFFPLFTHYYLTTSLFSPFSFRSKTLLSPP